MQDWYDVIVIHWTFNSFLIGFTFRGLKFIFFPIVLLKSFALLFIFQSFFIAISAPVIYLTAVGKGLRKDIGCILAISYLLFFPLAGANFFDIHNIEFFPTLFLLGYYFISKGNSKFSIFFFALASIVKYPLSILISIFAFIIILEFFLEKNKTEKNKKQMFAYLIIFLFSLGIFLIRYLYLSLIAHILLPGDV